MRLLMIGKSDYCNNLVDVAFYTIPNISILQVNYEDVCEIEGIGRLCHSKGGSLNADMDKPDKKVILPLFKKIFDDHEITTRHIFYGTKDGYFVQYPAERDKGKTECQCSRYDPRYR